MNWTDNQGMAWSPRFDLGVACEVKRQLGIDVLAAGHDVFRKISESIDVLAEVLWLTHADQAVMRGVDRNEFAKRLSGDAVLHASDALTDALIEFFPSRQQPTLRHLLAISREAAKRDVERAAAMATALTPEALALGNESGNWPASSASTPAE